MRRLKRAVHIDFHTMPGITDFGDNIDPAKVARTLRDARVDYVNVFAKCNLGFAYYPTEVGIPYPDMSFDLLGETIEECHRLDIGVSAYFNIGLDHEKARQHRDWTIVNEDGQVIYGDRTKNFFRMMCIHSPYRGYMLRMIQEVVDRYHVEGVFLDCMVIRPCYGNECLEMVYERGDEPEDPRVATAFAEERWVDFTREVKEIIGDDRFLAPNGLPWELTDGLRTHGEIECLPAGNWGYDYFPARVAYSRNIDPQVLYMTGRFNVSWGEFGGLKSEASLRNDCWDAVSNGAQPSIGDHMHPRDGLEDTVYDRIGCVYSDMEAIEPWTEDAKAVADIGILTAPGRRLTDSHSGAVRMLGELKYTYDIIDDRHDLAGYRLLILPDTVRIGPEFATKLVEYLGNGGHVISTGTSGLDQESDQFALGAWNMAADGLDSSTISYYVSTSDAGTACQPVPFTQSGVLLRGEPSLTTMAEYYDAYFQHTWDGFHGYFYTPPDKPAGRPAVVRSGPVIHCCFNLFANYLTVPSPAFKELLHRCIESLLPDPLLISEGIPSTARATLTRQPGRQMLHIKLTHPEPRGQLNIVEDYPAVADARIRVRTNDVSRVYQAPGMEPVVFEQEGDGYVLVRLDKIIGYQLVVLESGG